jgi:hypothetical protein
VFKVTTHIGRWNDVFMAEPRNVALAGYSPDSAVNPGGRFILAPLVSAPGGGIKPRGVALVVDSSHLSSPSDVPFLLSSLNAHRGVLERVARAKSESAANEEMAAIHDYCKDLATQLSALRAARAAEPHAPAPSRLPHAGLAAALVALLLGGSYLGYRLIAPSTRSITEESTPMSLDAYALKSDLVVKADKAQLDAKADRSAVETKADKSELAVFATRQELQGVAGKIQEATRPDASAVEPLIKPLIQPMIQPAVQPLIVPIRTEVSDLRMRVDALATRQETLASQIERAAPIGLPSEGATPARGGDAKIAELVTEIQLLKRRARALEDRVTPLEAKK